ncbi:hypothetical protein [Streptomyces sp. NPDC093109]|uniref:hypothetical protein n=1 Tax=Streptomyces sp. NPDC093109 TaxID=3154977 RepID=UPI00344F30C0
MRQAAAGCAAPNGASWQVLTDGRDWHSPPLALPQDPAAWYQLAAIGGWQAVITDTPHPVAHDILVARCDGRAGQTRGWCELPYAVPVLCCTATANGMHALQQTVMAMQAEGLPLQRTVIVMVATAGGRPPAVVRAGTTMLASRAAAVVDVPYDPDIRAYGLRRTSHLHSRTRQAADRLAAAVLDAAHTTWGDPLPDASRPARVPVAVPAL